MTQESAPTPGPKPPWLRRRLPAGDQYRKMQDLLESGSLHTVCQEAKCPNIWECFCEGTATFLIMGDKCTRQCRFCAVHDKPVDPPDPKEPARVAEAVKKMGLTFVVITSVTRDDLPDGGAEHFAKTIAAIREELPKTEIEVLIPDFQGDFDALKTVLDARPNVLNHNLETVERLYPQVRPEAIYPRSLKLLERARGYAPDIPTKSGLMLGLGEEREEVERTLSDLRAVGCSFLTIGQYLQPRKTNLTVTRYVTPEEFEEWKQRALELGFAQAASAPFVRSSYHAGKLYRVNADQ